MPRPEARTITFTIDGQDVQVPENTMLVDAAKHGDVEIPVFCYEPKLGQPVGACRMCLVEIEGIPKLQTGCSTPVKDGMVVYTQTDRVKTAQQSVVEFLLINHPLDCPVCDKGGECPLQDITFGWGGGISRFIEPKRHFVKPLELSPLIAIDRERCILCYRCVRFSQEVAEDYQLVLLERGAHSYVSTFDGHPYVAPFSGNIVELCPVGALTSRPYRFRARPWDIEGAGSVCTLCPAQCNVTITVRDERALRVLQRDNVEVDDGWLCDKGRFAYQSFHVDERIVEPMVRDGGQLRAVSWERALEEAAAGLGRAGANAAAIVGGQATNEEGFLLSRLMREGLGSPHLDSRRAGSLPLDLHRALGDPSLQAKVSDLEFAHAVLVLDTEPVNDAPILDLRLRKGVRQHGLKLAVASPHASSLDAGAALSVRYAVGAGGVFAGALSAALAGAANAEELARQASAEPEAVRALATLLKGEDDDSEEAPAREVVVLWGERLTAGAAGAAGAEALLDLADNLGVEGIDGAGLLELPAASNGRGALRARRAARRRGKGCARHRTGSRRWRAERPLPAPERPAARPPGRRAVGARPGRPEHGHRPRGLPDGGPARARDGHLPGRGIPGEGGHDRAPGRAPTASASRDRTAGPRARRMAADRRARPAHGSRPRRAKRGDGLQAAARGRAVLRRDHARGDRRARRALAGAGRRLRIPHSRDARARRRHCAGPPRRGRRGAGRLALGVGRRRGGALAGTRVPVSS
jgi:NADH-quinone oxidoreductase subunit G